MSYTYQDPVYKNGNKYKIGEQEWAVTGVLSIADDDSGRNARTDKLEVQQVNNGSYIGSKKLITPGELARAVANGHF